MKSQSLNVLLVYDNIDSKNFIEEVLRTSDIEQFSLECIPAQLVLKGVQHTRHDVCLVESLGSLATELILTLKATLNCPIIFVTWDSGTEVLNALHAGASDCLIRNKLTPATLEESICSVVDRARALDELGQYERWYLSLVENSSDLIFTCDLEGTFSFINHAFEKVTGYSQSDVMGMNFRQVFTPEEAELVWSWIAKMLEDRKPVIREVTLLSKNWRRVTVRMTTHLIYRHGAPIGFQGVIRAQGSTVSLRAVRAAG